MIFIGVLYVVYMSYNIGTWDLLDIYAHALGPAGPQAWGIYIRQIPCAHLITFT